MQRLMLGIAVVLIFAVTGCGTGTGRTAYREGTGKANILAQQQDGSGVDSSGRVNSESANSTGAAWTDKAGAANPGKIQNSKAVKSSSAAESPAADLVIKSNNQVVAGSKQAMVDQIDKEMDGLMDSLSKLESVDSRDLTME